MNLFVECLERYGSLIQGFNGELVPLERMISLPVKADNTSCTIVQMSFLVVKLLVSYNTILG